MPPLHWPFSPNIQDEPLTTRLIGVDIGGTKIDSVLMDAHGTILAERIVPTEAAAGVPALLDRIAASILHLAAQADSPVEAVGIGITGLVDVRTGTLVKSVHLGCQDIPMRAALETRLRPALAVPIRIENDLKAAALGEKRFGAGRNSQAFVYLAVGTGLGAAAVIDDAVVSGAHGMAMELGHIVLYPQSAYPDARPCPCGKIGCIETRLSGTGLLNGATHLLPAYPNSVLNDAAPLNTAAVLAAARAGDALGVRLLDEMRDALARTIMFCAAAYNPDLVVIGGGFGLAAYDLLTAGLHDLIRAGMLPDVAESFTIQRPEYPRQAVGAGAVGLALVG
ncbi:MAG: ROK family protein [bacterium]|nr:ROK family protein [bacterium]